MPQKDKPLPDNCEPTIRTKIGALIKMFDAWTKQNLTGLTPENAIPPSGTYKYLAAYSDDGSNRKVDDIWEVSYKGGDTKGKNNIGHFDKIKSDYQYEGIR